MGPDLETKDQKVNNSNKKGISSQKPSDTTLESVAIRSILRVLLEKYPPLDPSQNMDHAWG